MNSVLTKTCYYVRRLLGGIFKKRAVQSGESIKGDKKWFEITAEQERNQDVEIARKIAQGHLKQV